MGFLADSALRRKASGPQEIITGIDQGSINSAIRGCSIDLHVGLVYRPGKEPAELGGAQNPHTMTICLKEGETAVIQTKESFRLDAKHASFVFPKSSVSIQGLLMTNPGHVEPGYSGPLHVTVINMGKDAFAIQPGAKFLRAFIYELDEPADSPWSGSASTNVTEELLKKLSPDFMSVGARADKAAQAAVVKSGFRLQLMQVLVPALFTVGGVIATGWLTNDSIAGKFDDRIKSLENASAGDRIKTLELSYPAEKRMSIIENELRKISESLNSKDSSTQNSTSKATE